jgi:hypothetical protein
MFFSQHLFDWSHTGENFSGETGGLFEEPPALANEAVESVIQLEPASTAQHVQQRKGNLVN